LADALSAVRAVPQVVATVEGAGRHVWRVTAALAGICAGLILSDGDVAAAVWAALLGFGVLTLARVVARPSDLKILVTVAGLALVVRFAVALGIHAVAPGHGFVTGDDAAYFRLASNVTAYLKGQPFDPAYGPPVWGGDAYLLRGFVSLEIGLFLIFGPDVRIPLLLNAAFAVVSATLIYAAALRVFGSRAAIVAALVTAFYPSTLLWSSLNLKDALTVMLVALAVWSVGAMRARSWMPGLLLAWGAAEVLTTLRGYVAATVAMAAVVAALSMGAAPRRRIVAAGLAVALATLVSLQSLGAIGLGDQLLETLERTRQAMAVGARTGFVQTPSPARPADQPVARPPGEPLSVSPIPSVDDEEGPVAVQTVSYLPTGLVYALLAPFPWAARRPQELVAAPEMLFWYVLVVAAGVTAWRERRRWRPLAPPAAVAVALIVVLALAEGNVGTLFRHRGMVVPVVAMLASPTLAAMIARAVARGRGRRP